MTFNEILHRIQELGLETTYAGFNESESTPCLILSFEGGIWMNAFGEGWSFWNGDKGLAISLCETEQPDLRWPFELLKGQCDTDGVSNDIEYDIWKRKFNASGGTIFEERALRTALKCVERMLS